MISMTRHLLGFAISVASTLLLAPNSASAANCNLQKTTPANKPVEVDGAFALNPDCTSFGYAAVKLLTDPRNGSVSTKKTTLYSNYSAQNVRSRCNSRRSPGVALWYKPQRGFVGTDSISYEWIFPNGIAYTCQASILVE